MQGSTTTLVRPTRARDSETVKEFYKPGAYDRPILLLRSKIAVRRARHTRPDQQHGKQPVATRRDGQKAVAPDLASFWLKEFLSVW